MKMILMCLMKIILIIICNVKVIIIIILMKW